MFIYIYIYITRFLGPGHSRVQSALGSGLWGDGGSFLHSGRRFEILAERSSSRPDVRNLGRTIEVSARRSKFWPDFPDFRHSGRTFQIPAERLKFRPDVRNSCRTFKIPDERSKFWPNFSNSDRTFGKMKRRSAIKGPKIDFQNCSLKQT